MRPCLLNCFVITSRHANKNYVQPDACCTRAQVRRHSVDAMPASVDGGKLKISLSCLNYLFCAHFFHALHPLFRYFFYSKSDRIRLMGSKVSLQFTFSCWCCTVSMNGGDESIFFILVNASCTRAYLFMFAPTSAIFSLLLMISLSLCLYHCSSLLVLVLVIITENCRKIKFALSATHTLFILFLLLKTGAMVAIANHDTCRKG